MAALRKSELPFLKWFQNLIFITKILVGDKRKVNGEKVQSIEIHYRFIGNLTDNGMEQVNKKSS